MASDPAIAHRVVQRQRTAKYCYLAVPSSTRYRVTPHSATRTFSIAFNSVSASGLARTVAATFHPRSWKYWAVILPIPVLQPVINMVFLMIVLVLELKVFLAESIDDHLTGQFREVSPALVHGKIG